MLIDSVFFIINKDFSVMSAAGVLALTVDSKTVIHDFSTVGKTDRAAKQLIQQFE